MIYPVTVYGDALLRKVSKEIDPTDEKWKEVIENMFETMYYSDGVGLAAPQVGMSIRLFVIDATPMKEEEPELDGFKKVFFNAEIIERTGTPYAFEEGCLSVPHIREDVVRPETVTIRYVDENNEEKEETYSGFAARVIQHEYDHLEGKLFIDYASPLRKRLLKGKLTAISKGKVRTSYRIRIPGSK